MNYLDFAQRIKKQYPGAYDDMDDRVLAQKMVAKYPQYNDVVFTDQAQPAKVQDPGMLQKIAQVAATPMRGYRGVTIGLQNLMAGKGAVPSLERAAEATKPGFQPKGLTEGLAAGIGESVPLMPLGALGKGISLLAKAGIQGGIGAGQSALSQMSEEGEVTPGRTVMAAGLSGLPLAAAGAAKGLKKLGVNNAMRALGFTKRFLGNPADEAAAKAAASTALEEGVIPTFGKPEAIHANVSQMGDEAGRKIGEYLTSRGKGFKPQEAIEAIEKLRPSFKGGEYDPIHGVIDKAIETIKAHGNKPMEFSEANKLKSMFQEIAYELKSDKGGTRKAIAGSFRKSLDDQLQRPIEQMESIVEMAPASEFGSPLSATGEPNIQAMRAMIDKAGMKYVNFLPDKKNAADGIMMFDNPDTGSMIAIKAKDMSPKRILDEVIEQNKAFKKPPPKGPVVDMNVTQELKKIIPDAKEFASFQKNKRVYGAAELAKEGLENRMGSELGNKPIGLGSKILATTNIPLAIANHLYDRYGASASANLFNALSKRSQKLGQNPAMSTAFLRALVSRPRQKKEK